MDKNLEQFIDLVKQNPDLEVICMVDQEIVPCDDYARYMAGIGKSSVDEYYLKDERVYLKSDDLEEIEEDLENNIYYEFYDTKEPLIEEEEQELKYEVYKAMKKIPWKKAIILNIDL